MGIDKKFIDLALKEINNRIKLSVVDITNYDEVISNFKIFIEKYKIDIFVNNAGVAGLNDKVWNYPNEEWLKVINTNLNSTFYCCKVVVPHMINNNYGRIINIASIAGKEGNPNASAYSTSKAGVIALTKHWGKN